jgi:zinc protease
MTKKALSASVGFQGNSWQGGMQMLVYMLNQALTHGFSDEEYERVCAQIAMSLRQMEAQSSAQLPSNFIVQRCMDHILHGSPLLTMQQTAVLNRQLLSEMTLDKVNARFAEYLYSPGGVAILLQGRADENDQWPTEEEVVEAYIQSWGIPTHPHEIPQMEPAPELMPAKPQPGTIVKTRQNKRYGTTELTLSNGARVILKPTQGDAIRLTATSNGGTSLINDSEYANINAINALPSMGGLGELSGRDLGRALEGHNVSYKVNVGTLAETFSGGCDKADMEQLLQLLHLRFTTVRKDYDAFERWQQNTRYSVMQQQSSPMTLFADTLRSTMYEPHPRQRKATMALADSVDYDRTCQLFSERFANAADFTFIFVGHIDEDALAPLICHYIASLPCNAKQREKADLAAMPRLRRGKHVTHIQIPEAVTTVIYNITAKERYTARSNAACALLSEVMNSLCTETLREQEGGTYNVSVTSRISRQPANELTLMYNFSTNPQQARTLLNKAIGLLCQVAEEGPSAETFGKAREYLLKQHQDYKGSDAYWMAALTDYARYADHTTLGTGEALREVTPKDVQRLARKLIRSGHTAEVIMNPQ